MPRAYYNEIEPAAVHVLRALIDEDIIAPGDVDDRSIKEVRPSDLIGYTQCHFFAGGGLWSVALRLAEWSDERPVWTGSCPCQPFSQAGKGLGRDDPRHLWPDFHRLIAGARPDVVFGEQVAGAAGYDWFDGVAADLERENYAAEAFDIPAAAVGAPHIRQRLYWIAKALGESNSARRESRQSAAEGMGHRDSAIAGSINCGMADAARVSKRKSNKDVRPVARQDARIGSGWSSGGYGNGGMADALRAERRAGSEGAGNVDDWKNVGREKATSGRDLCRTPDTDPLGGANGARLPQRQGKRNDDGAQLSPAFGTSRNGSFWSDHEWRTGADGKARRVKPGVRLLVAGLPGRVGLLRIAGNAIVPQLAAEVIKAFMESE